MASSCSSVASGSRDGLERQLAVLWLPEPGSPAAALGDSIFRVWSQGTPAWFFAGRSNYQLNRIGGGGGGQMGRHHRQPVDQMRGPRHAGSHGQSRIRCNSCKSARDIELRFEEFDALRKIHMGAGVARPADAPLSPLGYSVGRWDGKTLVVDTSRINWPYFDRSGAPQTQNVTINERFTVVPTAAGSTT
jgi:hypothetical protein